MKNINLLGLFDGMILFKALIIQSFYFTGLTSLTISVAVFS